MTYTFEDLTFTTLTEDDIPALTAVMTAAFDEDSQVHLGEAGGPPGYNDGSFLRKFGMHPDSTAFTITQEGKLVGGLILWLRPEEAEGFLGTIFLHPSTRGQHMGQKVWRFVEHQWPMIKRWHTETPGFSVRNHNFYINKLGFHVVKIENPFDPHESSYDMTKQL